MITREEAYQRIQNLVTRFEEQIDSYKQADYNETLTRRDFIDPFFKALGWDVDNSQGYAEAYREVIHEDRVKVGKATKEPDYSFRLPGGKRLFFVEAKKPSVDIKDNVSVSYQIKRYGWSAKLAVSIITDFEEFAVYDCTKKPKPNDKPGVARIRYITFKDYLEEFDYLWDTFSKERVLKGGLDRYIQSDTVKKGTATVDKEFLSSLDAWRTYLAKSITLRNLELDGDEINYAVQLIIDRLIFLRIAEDRGVEHYGQLKMAVKQKGDAYQNLFYNFKQADEKYNSGLFDFKKDVISEHLIIDNKVIRNIINEMYYPESPYEFSVISVEILGSAYEQFLGKQIRVTPAHHVKIEEKPEVRKAGGVYYTPQYVVDYIVKNTVGKLIEGKSPGQIEKLKICDPACGSGSFLLGAFQYLLDYHKNYYSEKGVKTGKKESPLTPAGELTSAEKKRILLNSVYGVDIDVNAVEVTKLSLLLKCMEGETETTVSQQQKLFHERILPSLDDNIKSGNSLVDIDFYSGELDFGEEKKIKPFNWQKAFPEVFKHGGFDVVIGNPPWGAEFGSEQTTYLIKKYPQLPSKTKDSYFAFIFRALNLLKPNGNMGFIIPNTWLLINYAESFRKFILKYKTQEIIDFGDGIFSDAIVESSTLILENAEDNIGKCKAKRIRKGEVIIDHVVNKAIWNNDAFNRIIIEKDEKTEGIIQKIKKVNTESFNTNCEIIWGIKPYQVGHGTPVQTKEMQEKRIYHSNKKEDSSWKPLLVGSNVNRYLIIYENYQYIKYGKNLMYPSNEERMLSPKILMRQTSDRIRASYDDKQFYCQNSVFIISSKKFDLKFLLGLLNSNLFDFLYRFENPQKGKIYAEIKPSAIKALPIKIIESKSEVQVQNEIMKLVNQLLKLNSEKLEMKLESRINQISSKIDYCEDRINQLVYQLYGLTEEEIEIVEQAVE